MASSSSLSNFFSFFFLVSCFSECVNGRHSPVHHELSFDFYARTCPQVDELVGAVTSRRFRDSPAAVPGTLRLFFHDCFVEGCDGSVLIAPEGGGGSSTFVEKEAWENENLPPEAFETVNEAKAAVESKCPAVVSCADILAVAARDFIHLAGGPYYEVKKGRRDSKVALGVKVRANLPRANSTVDELLHLFARKGLGIGDLVALSGAHTIGFSHCDQFVSRLYDFRGSGKPDSTVDTRLLRVLRQACPAAGGNADVTAPVDVQTPFDFDHAYYANLEASMGLLATDQALYADQRTRPMVSAFAGNKTGFFEAFSAAIEKMGSIRVKKGKKGEVRRDCSRHNN